MEDFVLRKFIENSTISFVTDILSKKIALTNRNFTRRSYAVSISLEGLEDKKSYEIKLYMGKKVLLDACNVFLFEQDLNDETLEDLAKEVANIIVGTAKVKINETFRTKYKLSTPKFLGLERVQRSDFRINFDYEDDMFSITGKKH